MFKFILPLLLVGILAPAQTHRFIYEFKFKTDSLAEDFRTENMVSDVNPDEVKFLSIYVCGK